MNTPRLPSSDYLAAWRRTPDGSEDDRRAWRAFLRLVRAFLQSVRRLIRRGIQQPEVLQQARSMVVTAIERCQTLPPSSRKTATLAALKTARLLLDAAIARRRWSPPPPGVPTRIDAD